MSGKLVDRLLKKTWSDSDINRYVGEYVGVYLTHAREIAFREKAASGGATSAILIDCLRRGSIDGAVVCRTVVDDGKVRAHFVLATTEEEILSARGSKYVETRFLKEVLPLIRNFSGRVAVTGLPCDLTALKHRASKEPELQTKIGLTIALVCGHNSRVGLIDEITSRLEKEVGSRLTDYRFRVGHWRGNIEAEFANGRTLCKPTKYFNDYQNLFMFCQRKCLACSDHFGYAGDITVGDVWLFRLRDDPIKHTALIARTQIGQTACQDAIDNGTLESQTMDIRDVMDGQARIGPAHYNVSARQRAGSLFGIRLKDTVRMQVSWHSYLNAILSMAGMRLSESPAGQRLIFATPRPILKSLLYMKKALESLK